MRSVGHSDWRAPFDLRRAPSHLNDGWGMPIAVDLLAATRRENGLPLKERCSGIAPYSRSFHSPGRSQGGAPDWKNDLDADLGMWHSSAPQGCHWPR